MIKKISALILALSLLACSGEKTPKDLTVINFQESAKKEVTQDSYKAILKFEQIGDNVVELQNNINLKMQEGVAAAKLEKDLDVSTGNYNVNQYWSQQLNKFSGYQAFQEIILDSQNKDALLKVAQKLQASGFIMSSLDSYLSPKTIASYRNELIEEALNRVKDRAGAVAKNLGKKQINIAQININSNDYSPYQGRVMMMKANMAPDAAMVAPTVEPSKQNVSIDIAVTVNLRN